MWSFVRRHVACAFATELRAGSHRTTRMLFLVRGLVVSASVRISLQGRSADVALNGGAKTHP